MKKLRPITYLLGAAVTAAGLTGIWQATQSQAKPQTYERTNILIGSQSSLGQLKVVFTVEAAGKTYSTNAINCDQLQLAGADNLDVTFAQGHQPPADIEQSFRADLPTLWYPAAGQCDVAQYQRRTRAQAGKLVQQI